MTKQEKINKFLTDIAEQEAGKSEVKIGDMRQVLRLIDKSLGGIVYKAIELKLTDTN